MGTHTFAHFCIICWWIDKESRHSHFRSELTRRRQVRMAPDGLGITLPFLIVSFQHKYRGNWIILKTFLQRNSEAKAKISHLCSVCEGWKITKPWPMADSALVARHALPLAGLSSCSACYWLKRDLRGEVRAWFGKGRVQRSPWYGICGAHPHHTQEDIPTIVQDFS